MDKPEKIRRPATKSETQMIVACMLKKKTPELPSAIDYANLVVSQLDGLVQTKTPPNLWYHPAGRSTKIFKCKRRTSLSLFFLQA
jgi:hypothetical protein